MEEKPTTPEAVPQWQLDLDKVGFVRRLFLARKWYGGDWWFVAISAVLLLFIILLGVAPQWFAPHDPREEVGPALLAPGEHVLTAREVDALGGHAAVYRLRAAALAGQVQRYAAGGPVTSRASLPDRLPQTWIQPPAANQRTVGADDTPYPSSG